MKVQKVLMLCVCLSLFLARGVQASIVNDKETFEEKNIEYSFVDSKSVEVSSYSGNASELIIPSEVNGYKVVAIGDNAFYENKVVKKIALPNTIVRIGMDSFSNSTLESINLPESVREVWAHAFALTPVFENNKVDGVAYIDNVCLGMREDGLIEDVKESEKVSINVLSDTKSIAAGAFSNNRYIKEVTIPESVKNVGVSAFSNCINLEKVEIESKDLEVSYFAFSNCKNLRTVRGNIAYLEGSEGFKNTPFKTALLIKKSLIAGGVIGVVLLLTYSIYKKKRKKDKE
ncbi:MAG: leucine-rich repeat domain-containing protein [Lachnospiraceae bacterium]|nr:leucine-rich repeat domain-containing protein [Lachnospiraceae bacterium]